MKAAEKEQLVRETISSDSGQVLWSTHAAQRLISHGLERRAVEDALAACTLIEDYPDGHRPLPDCLVLTRLEDGSPIHAVVAIDEARRRILVVTVYRPDPMRWSDDSKRRR